MQEQTITRAIETELDPSCVYRVLSDAKRIPEWAPVFADGVEHVSRNSYTVSEAGETFSVEVLASETSGTVDYVREMAGGRRGGAYVRVTPRPLGGSTVVMTVPLGPGAVSTEIARVLMQELEVLVALAAASV